MQCYDCYDRSMVGVHQKHWGGVLNSIRLIIAIAYPGAKTWKICRCLPIKMLEIMLHLQT